MVAVTDSNESCTDAIFLLAEDGVNSSITPVQNTNSDFT